MKITRWRAERLPTQQDIQNLFKEEGLEAEIEEFPGGSSTREHRHPFDEIRVVIAGTLRFNVAGNEFILRAGDRLELPSNTRHWMRSEDETSCISVIAHRVT